MASKPTMSSFSTTDAVPSGNVGGAGGAGAPPSGNVNDLFDQLKEFSWKGVSFPSTEDDVDIAQDLVPHKFADRNGAYVEGTGRRPVQITAQIPFLNHIYSSPNESWPQGALYPYQWRLFLNACLEGTSGPLQHPELGIINCKIDLAKTRWSGKVRGGVWVSAVWIESDDTHADHLGEDLSKASPIGNLVAMADDLDEAITTFTAAVTAQQNPLPPLEFSFDQLASAIVGVIDSTTVLEKQAQGRTQNIIYQANRIQDSLARSPIMGPLSWPIFQSASRMKDAAYNASQRAAITGTNPILSKTIQKDMTLAQACFFVGATLAEIIALNYRLVSLPVLPAGTEIRYYAQSA